MIATRVFSIRDFNVAIKLCNLVFIRVRPLYIISSWFSSFCFGFLYLGTLMGSESFIESFVVEDFHEDLEMICNLPMLANL
jgi:hypothetical protein